MLTSCEVAVKCALPAIRAMIAIELMRKHNFNQAQTAKLLGVSQPAISLYCGKIRGKALSLENSHDVGKHAAAIADDLACGNISHKNFVAGFCEICQVIRSKGLLCQMHRKFDPSIDKQYCGLRFDSINTRCP